MTMTANEICMEYRLAKNKSEQIKILADENCTSREEIIKVLQDCGENVETARTQTKKKIRIAAAVVNVLYARIDELDVQIKEHEHMVKNLSEEYSEIASFLKSYDLERQE